MAYEDKAVYGVGEMMYYLDGKRMTTCDAFHYLLDNGFNKVEANRYMNLLVVQADKEK